MQMEVWVYVYPSLNMDDFISVERVSRRNTNYSGYVLCFDNGENHARLFLAELGGKHL